VWLSWGSYREDAHDPEYQTAVEEGEQAARRAKELARAQGIPVAGAVTLLRTDPKTEGPRLCEQQCVVCHNYSTPEGRAVTSEAPSALELYGFASREWIAGFLDPEKIAGPDYYGNTKFATGVMVRYVEGTFAWLGEEEKTAIIATLSAEARLSSERAQNAGDEKLIEKGRKLIVEQRCTRCHRFHEEGPQGSAPDLTGYGSQEWIMGIVMDPTHDSFYGARNDRMPAYLETPEKPTENRLSADQLQLVADWLHGRWHEPAGPSADGEAKPDDRPMVRPAMLTVAGWASRRAKPADGVPDTPDARARALYRREHCFICHGYTAVQGEPIVSAEPSAPDLGGFASKEWLTGLLDPKQVSGPKYFGNSVFANGSMAKFVRGNLRELVEDLEEEDKDALAKLIAALADQAKRDAPADPDDVPDETKYLFEDFTCTDCHKFYDLGEANLGSAPDLTGYGSREWVVGILSDPTHKRFYGSRNDGMPSYRSSQDDPQRNLLTADEARLLADWLRGVDEAKGKTKGE
jgi:ubiquinol-cytochrome c reductase cytochrome b subunit